ncbi:hypothetical protein J2Y69_000636 [Microbacterium resistens]|uniref:Uncharacterized protein n=1 Tax=Microbacterium resistens TaxID=156977 RepID=A0ABU1S8V9_9MICO|nr:hypothetical protein [Microbacterium resistens]MDR6866051.1 hypothetical protein [Microbacterium resistens]
MDDVTARFRDRQIALLNDSGWIANPVIRGLLAEAGLPSPVEHLAAATDDQWWGRAEAAVSALEQHLAGFRFAPDVEYGLLLVPSPTHLDTRGRMPIEVRQSQNPDLGEDFVDDALGAGADVSQPGTSWSAFASITGRYGISAGSYDDITAEASRLVIDGIDTRTAMTRQLWGARLLQAANRGVVPDSDINDTWTFTLFPGEPLNAGQAASGTVLKGRVRFRLGKTDRGIGSARVAPAIPLNPLP